MLTVNHLFEDNFSGLTPLIHAHFASCHHPPVLGRSWLNQIIVTSFERCWIFASECVLSEFFSQLPHIEEIYFLLFFVQVQTLGIDLNCGFTSVWLIYIAPQKLWSRSHPLPLSLVWRLRSQLQISRWHAHWMPGWFYNVSMCWMSLASPSCLCSFYKAVLDTFDLIFSDMCFYCGFLLCLSLKLEIGMFFSCGECIHVAQLWYHACEFCFILLPVKWVVPSICTWSSKFMEVWSGGTEENRALPSFEEWELNDCDLRRTLCWCVILFYSRLLKLKFVTVLEYTSVWNQVCDSAYVKAWE